MRRVQRAAALAFAGLLHAGCLVSSLHPIYGDDDIVFDEALLGTWEHRETEVSIVVTRGSWKSYEAAYSDRFGTTRFTLHLTAIGRARFVNVRPETGIERPAFVVVTHGWMQVEHSPSGLRLREPDYDAIARRLAAGRLGVDAATDMKGNVIVTAAPPRLRAWLQAATDDAQLWAEWKTLTRRTR